MLRLKQQTASRRIPCNPVVGFAGRIYKPGCGLLRNRPSHIKGQRKATLSRGQIFYDDRLRHRTAPAWQEHPTCKPQVFGGLHANHTVREPLIVDVAVGRASDREEPAVQEHFAGQEKARAPGGLCHATAGIRRERDCRDRRNRFPHLRVAKLVHRQRAIEKIAQPVGQPIRRHVGQAWRRRERPFGEHRSRMRGRVDRGRGSSGRS